MSKAPMVHPDPASQPREHHYAPQVENRRAVRPARPLRVVAFNAGGGSRFQGILECLRRAPLDSASVILLCEVDVGTARTRGRRVAAELAQNLGMSVGYVPEYGLFGAGGDARAYLGNAILSAYPLEDVSVIPLPLPIKRYFRSVRPLKAVGGPAALTAVIQVGHERLRVCVAHLDSRCSPAGRALQMEALTSALPASGSTILGGDFNTTTAQLGAQGAMVKVPAKVLMGPRRFRWPEPYEPLFERLRDAGFKIDGANASGRGTFTFSRIVPPMLRPRLDWIALRELEPVAGSPAVIPARTSIVSQRVSDHDFITVDVRV